MPQGTVTQGVAGRIGNAVEFNGPTESRLIASDGEVSADQSLTFEAWVYLDTLQSGNYVGLVMKDPDSGIEWKGLMKDNLDRIEITWQCCGGAWAGNLHEPVMTTSTWYHVVGTFDDATKVRRLFVDGAQVSTDVGADLGVPLQSYLRIGDDSNGNFHDGIIDEVRVSDVVRSADWTWLSWNRGRGDRITIDGIDCTILSVDGETNLTLSSPFAGTPGSGKSYTIARKFSTLRAWENCIDGAGGGVDSGANDNWAVVVQDDHVIVEWLEITGGTTTAAHAFNVVADTAQNQIVLRSKPGS